MGLPLELGRHAVEQPPLATAKEPEQQQTEPHPQKTGDDDSDPWRNGYGRVDLIRWAGDWLTAYRSPQRNWSDMMEGFNGPLDPNIQMFLLARACAGQGQPRSIGRAENAQNRLIWARAPQLIGRLARRAMFLSFRPASGR